MSTVYVKTYPASAPDFKEVLRYAGIRGENAEALATVRTLYAGTENLFAYRVCFSKFAVRITPEGALDLGFCVTPSADLKKNLAGCASVVLFAATVGLGIDRRIAAEGVRSPTNALYLQALGSERVEALCDLFCSELRARTEKDGGFTRPRFSPGYGDLPLKVQLDVFAALDCPRYIGVSLKENLMMTPSKSVTAIVGCG
ncbi:MAG: Vitamin B12 dependent methionine synthase activation subunit [Clostridia bacterium]|nr:Vitamin B12 dependent methionine synthase activation subunit [Clostridia bacterium]